ncbi:acyl-CoA N-acyltransferase [Mycena alexandri]|uniref:Acyl-CoA N-acyltransferase n=1 Tax=Mycena alexandri TaxID=1745969 RepID=A0AAD6TNS6_9AGAR|nr:acyl-CoA N-acyltransferase [Mycena alexandri]
MHAFRLAEPADAAHLQDLVQRAYRSSDEGWTTEKSMLAGERINIATILKKLEDTNARVLVAVEDSGHIIGCCEIAHVQSQNNTATFGLFAVEPRLQSAGLGRKMLAHAEATANAEWGVTRVEMNVVAQREELIAWYLRRGYISTGEKRPFPFDKNINVEALRDDLYFVVLVKTL